MVAGQRNKETERGANKGDQTKVFEPRRLEVGGGWRTEKCNIEVSWRGTEWSRLSKILWSSYYKVRNTDIFVGTMV